MPVDLFNELYRDNVTHQNQQETLERMAAKMSEKWDPMTAFNNYTNRQELYRYVTQKCGDRANDNAMVRHSFPSMEAVPDLKPACREWK